MKYESWHNLQNLLNSQSIEFKNDIILINEYPILGFKNFRSIIVQARDNFFEECRENYIEDDNKELVLQTFNDLASKLNYLMLEFFPKMTIDGDEITLYNPLRIDITHESEDLIVNCLRYMYKTILLTQDYLIERIEKEGLLKVESLKPTKRPYKSTYIAYGYLLHPKLKSNINCNIRLQMAYDSLKDEKITGDGYLDEFLRLFNGTPFSRKIHWIGSLKLLKYFISQLLVRNIIEDPKRKLYEIAEKSFIRYNGKEIEKGTLSARTDPSDTVSIDRIIDIIQGKKST